VAQIKIEKRVQNFVWGNMLELVRGQQCGQVTVKVALCLCPT
jgi:hypothetical protein